MAVVRRADPVDLAGLRAAEEPRSTTRGRLRRWLPISIGLALAVTMVVVAAAAPLIAPLSPSAQYSAIIFSGSVMWALSRRTSSTWDTYPPSG